MFTLYCISCIYRFASYFRNPHHSLCLISSLFPHHSTIPSQINQGGVTPPLLYCFPLPCFRNTPLFPHYSEKAGTSPAATVCRLWMHPDLPSNNPSNDRQHSDYHQPFSVMAALVHKHLFYFFPAYPCIYSTYL